MTAEEREKLTELTNEAQQLHSERNPTRPIVIDGDFYRVTASHPKEVAEQDAE